MALSSKDVSVSYGAKVDNIIGQLSHPLPAIRYNAVRALAELKDPQTIESLFYISQNDHSETVRQAAAQALKTLGQYIVANHTN